MSANGSAGGGRPRPAEWMRTGPRAWRRERPLPLGRLEAEIVWSTRLAAYSVRVRFVFTHPALQTTPGDQHYQPVVGTLDDAFDLTELWMQEIEDCYRDWAPPGG